MKKNILHITTFLVLSSAICSCTKEKAEAPGDKLDLSISTSVVSMSGPDTKADLLNSGSAIPGNTLKLYGWEGSSIWINGVDATFSADKWTLPTSYKMKKTNDYSFLAYANLPSEGASITAPSTKDGGLKLSVTDIMKAQNDVLLGRATKDAPTSGDVTLDFSHPLASVSFKLGNSPQIKTVTALSLDGVISSGYTELSQSSTESSGKIQYDWKNLGDAYAAFQVSGLNKTEGQMIATFVVIPQNLSTNNAVVTVTYDETDAAGGKKGEKMTKILKTGSWDAGYTTTYTLTKVGEVSITVSGSTVKNMQPNSKIYVRATITGAWYDASENVVAPWSASAGSFESLPGAGWTSSGDYYYYGSALNFDQSTTALFTKYTPSDWVTDATLKLHVLVQAIPYDVNKTCQEAFEALSE